MVLSSRQRNMLPMARALLFLVLLGFSLDFSFGNSKLCAFAAGDDSHGHLHCDHGHHHNHLHNHDDSHDKEKWERSKLLPEELAEEEDMKLYGFGPYVGHVDDHDHTHFGTSDLSTTGLWIRALSCSLLVSLASLICLVLLPIIFVQGKPSKAIVDSLALFGAGAMLGDAFLHQLPHAFGGGHSHGNDNHDGHGHGHDHAGHDHSHAHSLADLSVGISILAGIILFLLVEKVLRYVEDTSGGGNKWSHGHHHHHHKKSDNLKDDSINNDRQQSQDKDGEKAVESFEGDMPSEVSTLKGEKVNKRVLRKRNTAAASNDDTQADNVNGPMADTEILHEKPPPEATNLLFGYLNLVSDGVHNFTDGMALGSAFLLHGSVGGWSKTLFLLVHELPQEVGDFGILVRSGFSVSKALFFNFLSALVALAGTALALLLGKDPGQSSLIEGFTAGGFIYIAVAGVLAEMNSSGKTTLRSIAVQLTSLLAGMAIALGISLVE